MRHLSSLVVLLLLFVAKSPLHSQHYLGVSGGGGINTEVVFRAAVQHEVSLSQNVSLQTELAYIERENRELLLRLIGKKNFRHAKISYLELPIFVKAKMPVKSIQLYALAGAKIGYGLRLSASYLEDSRLIEERLQFGEQHVSHFDFGLNLGAGIEKTINKDRKIFIDYRFYLGLLDIDQLAETDIFNQGHVFNIGFLIPISREKRKTAKQ